LLVTKGSLTVEVVTVETETELIVVRTGLYFVESITTVDVAVATTENTLVEVIIAKVESVSVSLIVPV
jgi:hypothetical protein